MARGHPSLGSRLPFRFVLPLPLPPSPPSTTCFLPSLGGLEPSPLPDPWDGTAFRGSCWSPGLFRWARQSPLNQPKPDGVLQGATGSPGNPRPDHSELALVGNGTRWVSPGGSVPALAGRDVWWACSHPRRQGVPRGLLLCSPHLSGVGRNVRVATMRQALSCFLGVLGGNPTCPHGFQPMSLGQRWPRAWGELVAGARRSGRSGGRLTQEQSSGRCAEAWLAKGRQSLLLTHPLCQCSQALCSRGGLTADQHPVLFPQRPAGMRSPRR